MLARVFVELRPFGIDDDRKRRLIRFRRQERSERSRKRLDVHALPAKKVGPHFFARGIGSRTIGSESTDRIAAASADHGKNDECRR